MKKTFTFSCLLFVLAFFVNSATAQDAGGLAPAIFGATQKTKTSTSLQPANTSNVEKPASIGSAPKTNTASSFRPPANTSNPFSACANWIASTVYPIPVLDQAVASVGANLYSFAGVSNNAVVTNSYKFDGTTWTPILPYPVAVEYPAAAGDGTNIFIVAGALTGTGAPQTTMYRYDVAANTYTLRAPCAIATWNPTAVYLNGKIYKFGGTTAVATVSSNALEIYDIAGNTWSAGANMPTPGSFIGGFTDGTYIYACGGLDANGTVPSLKTYRYDVVANTWNDAAIADLPATRWGPAYGFVSGGGILAGGYVGGAATANISNTAISWDPTSNTWSSLSNLVGERSRLNGAVVGGNYYAVGGRSVASSGFVGTNDNQKLTCGGPAIIAPAPTTLISESCFPANNAIDPGETVTVSFCVLNTGGTNTTNLVGTLQNTGGVSAASGPQNYGVVIAGGAAVCRNFTFTANGVCGNTITASIQLQDGAVNLGTVTYVLRLGALNTVTVLSQNFDAVAVPTLPAGWTAITGVAGAGSTPWATINTASQSAPNSAFTNNPGVISDEWLNSPTIAVPATGASLTFANRYTLESTFDGMVLEISINGSAFTDIITAGGSFVAGGYNGVISTTFGNPIGGRNAWTGASAGYPAFITTTVTLPATANGQNVVLRWRRATDSSVSSTGSGIDNVVLSTSSYVCCSGCTPASIATQPATATVCPTGTATFTVVPGGSGPFTYVWQESITGVGGPFTTVTNGGVYSGATTATLSIAPVTAGMNGYAYRVTVTGSCGGSATSNPALLSVIATTLGGTINPPTTTHCTTPNSGTLTLSGHTGNIIRWESSTTSNAGPWTNIANTTTTQSYTNITNTTWYRVLVQASGCAAVYSTVAVVNGNPQVVIIADPGTTICEGDPTLLTVVLGTQTPVGTLYTQGTNPAANGSPSQVFEPANAAFTSQSADDFTVPAGSSWTITQVTAGGIGAGAPTSVNVFVYNNSGSNLPGTVVASYPNIATFVNAGGNYTVTLPSSLTLGGGTYWLSVQVNMSFATGGQWFWGNFGAANIGNEYAWQNPGGGFATPCTSWGYGSSGCAVGGGVNRNNVFSLVGTSITGGGPLIPGYTFLWSPAAGLSSVTSNPVAASPMNTTTYSVIVTTPAGCTRTATILINVNKRPTVTTQPVSTVNCSGTTATFTVGAIGAGLTYQWQVSTTGCAGPWTNIFNGGVYSGATSATLNINPVSGIMSGYAYRVVLSGTCAPVNGNNISNCVTLTVNPLPVVTITPAGPVCGGVAGLFGTQLSTASAPPPVPGSVTISSGTINLLVPDGDAAGTTNALTIAGVPANATITNISVALNMPHTYPHDMIIGLKGPSGQVLSLYKHNTNTTVFPAASIPSAGWYNGVVSRAASTVFSTVPDPFRYGQTAPAGPYKADALNGVTSAGYTINDQTGYVSNAANFDALYTTPASINNSWTLALCDGGAGDIGTLASWSMTIDYTTPGTTNSTLSYVWSPLAGLYNDPQALSPYLGTNTPVVYAAPTTLTVYTVTATNTITGCVSTASVVVNYTPPAPTVTPTAVTMCLGDPAVRITSLSSTSVSTTVSASSGAINVPIPDATGVAAISTLNIAGVPAGATIGEVKVTMNVNHTWVGDVAVNLKAPNNQVLNLVGRLDGGAGGNASDDFTATAFSSLGGLTISGAGAPRTGTYATEARALGPVGYVQTTATWGGAGGLVPTGPSANGTWTLALGDFVGTDIGALTSWSIAVTYVVTTGVPSTRATWSPIAGLYTDPSALPAFAYTGDARDTVWARPTPAGVYPYQVTVQSLPAFLPTPMSFTNPAPITITNGGSTPYPSNLVVAGVPTTGTTVRSVILTGLSHTWSDDIDVVLQSPTGTNTILMSDVGGAGLLNNVTYTFQDGAGAMGTTANATGTYRPTNLVGTLGVEPDNFPAPGPLSVPQPNPVLSSFTGNLNGTWKLFVVDDFAGDDGTISGGYTINFNVPVAPCTSPARTVIVTVNQPAAITTQPVSRTICTDKVATFTVVATGTAPLTYQWQVSTNSGNTWTNITNGGVYSGATTATLTITAPPVSMSGYFYRVIINGAAPCGSVTSFQVVLTVNPLPVVVISADRTSLFPGLTATLTSTVSPNAPAPNGGYTWLRNGVIVPGAITGTYVVDIDHLGDYQLRITDVNGCTNVSNIITIKDSVSGKCFIYPNPTSGQFQVRYHSVAANVLPRTLTVYDTKGDRVFTKLYTIGRPYDRMDVDMRAYGKGLYWVEIGDANGNRITMCRVVIQ